MPHVIVKLWPGKSEEQKNRLAEEITKDVMGLLNYGAESVSVALQEVEPQDWGRRFIGPTSSHKPATFTRSRATRCDATGEMFTMGTWSRDELQQIATNDDLYISPFRDDGVTCGTPTWIWSVAVGDELFVRAYNGQNSRWYRAAIRQKAGRITAAGMTKEIIFEPVNDKSNDRIDNAYREKYKGSAYLRSMIGARARAATLRVVPR
jgi:phenylpyruvate tautomerase PptA (4-oxalocrotonate tautomerase family)